MFSWFADPAASSCRSRFPLTRMCFATFRSALYSLDRSSRVCSRHRQFVALSGNNRISTCLHVVIVSVMSVRYIFPRRNTPNLPGCVTGDAPELCGGIRCNWTMNALFPTAGMPNLTNRISRLEVVGVRLALVTSSLVSVADYKCSRTAPIFSWNECNRYDDQTGTRDHCSNSSPEPR